MTTTMMTTTTTATLLSLLFGLSLLSSSVVQVQATYSNSGGAVGKNFFADTMNSSYTGYQQAWRYLGHMVKCGYPSSRFDSSNNQASHEHSKDNQKNTYTGNHYCQRYLVWAAVSSKLVWFGLVWFGLVWFGLVWFGLVWFGLVWVVPGKRKRS
jgi:hypothetical protein